MNGSIKPKMNNQNVRREKFNMRKSNQLDRTIWMAAAGLVLTAVSSLADPTVNLTLTDYSTLDLAQVGGYVAGVQMEDAYIGIYSFSLSNPVGVTGLPSTIESVCLSPLGDLTDESAHQYSYQTFAEANAGINPTAWQWNGVSGAGAQYWGIQNANYLWAQLSPAIISGGSSTANQTAAAALAMAMYDSLYNSTAYGVVGTGTMSKGYLPDFASTLEGTDYTNDIALLNGPAVSASLAAGYVFVPTDETQTGPSGQEFIILATAGGNVTSVPEPTTIVAASLLILPFGASTLRILRKKHTA
jgi:hypothetical protein